MDFYFSPKYIAGCHQNRFYKILLFFQISFELTFLPWQKKWGEAIKEIFRRVRPEGVHKRRNSMLDEDDDNAFLPYTSKKPSLQYIRAS